MVSSRSTMSGSHVATSDVLPLLRRAEGALEADAPEIAERTLTEALALAPTCDEARVLRGALRLDLGRFSDAEADLTAVLTSADASVRRQAKSLLRALHAP